MNSVTKEQVNIGWFGDKKYGFTLVDLIIINRKDRNKGSEI